jgi:hypothetical protein
LSFVRGFYKKSTKQEEKMKKLKNALLDKEQLNKLAERVREVESEK